jgi:hypothetical protein
MYPTTQEEFFAAFMFAAMMFLTGTIIVYFQHHQSRAQMQALHVRLGESINSEISLKNQLVLSETSKATLAKKIDLLIMRREDLLSCLQAATTDEQRVACIHKLMES